MDVCYENEIQYLSLQGNKDKVICMRMPPRLTALYGLGQMTNYMIFIEN